MATNYCSCLWVNSLMTSRDESSEVDETSLNKQPTGNSSRSISHKQATEDAHCYLLSVFSGNWNRRCADVSSFNRSAECYVAFTVLVFCT